MALAQASRDSGRACKENPQKTMHKLRVLETHCNRARTALGVFCTSLDPSWSTAKDLSGRLTSQAVVGSRIRLRATN